MYHHRMIGRRRGESAYHGRRNATTRACSTGEEFEAVVLKQLWFSGFEAKNFGLHSTSPH